VSLWRQLTRGLRGLIRRSALEQDVADEVQHYIDEATADYLARGLRPDQALRAARIEMGSATSVRQQVRSSGWENTIRDLVADLRYGARGLWAAPGFTAITVLTLALGIGATTAILSALNPILFAPLPYPDAARIAAIGEIGPDGSRADGTFGMYRELALRAQSFEAIAAFRPWQPTMTGQEQPERLNGQRIGASYFRVLGVSPRLGGDFQESDDRGGGPNVVIISDALWRRRFGGDPAIVGRQLMLDENTYAVAGVMPRGFENVLAPSAELWVPLQYDISQGRAWGHHLRAVGRLRTGVDPERAVVELNALGRAVIDEQRPETYPRGAAFAVSPLGDEVTRSVKPALLAVLGAALLLLIIACVNVTNLLLARGLHRRVEFALRAALGAGRERLVRQLITECLLLTAIGGGVGMLVAVFGVRTLVAISPPGLPRADAIEIDRVMFAFGLAVTTIMALLVGLIPALQAARNDPDRELRHDSRRTGRGHSRLRNALVVAEVALALVLLVGSGLLLRSLDRLFAVESGFDASDVLTMQVQAAGRRFNDNATTLRFFAQVLEAVRTLPEVASAALTSQLPISGDADLYGVHFDPKPLDDPGELNGTFRYAISPGYIETMRIPLRRGRLLDARDQADAPPAALISESLAKRRLPDRDPLGQRLRIGAGALYTVVGVVGDVKQMSLAMNEADAVYVTTPQWRFADRAMTLVIRARGNAAALAPAVRQAVWSIDKDQPIVRVMTMDGLLEASAAERRFAFILFEVFALVALMLAAAGIYGVLAGSVAERTREIGVRAALGASRASLLGLMLRQGMLLTGLGAAIGLAGAAASSQVLSTMLFGISHLDPVTYLGVIVLLAGVAAIACAVPAVRAMRVDPAITLRAE
jgi:putative ABC transport system permease protein